MQLSRDDTAEQLEAEKERARQTLLCLIPSKPGMTTYERVWPRVLERHVVTRPEVNSMAARMRKDGTLEFPNWEMGKRVPHDTYRVCRVASTKERPC